MTLIRFDFLARLLLGLAFGLAGAAIWRYQGGTGPLNCALGGLACAASGALALSARSRLCNIIGVVFAACGYMLLWSATLDLWRALSFDRAGHYLAYPMILIARAFPLLLSLILVCASLLCIATSISCFRRKPPDEKPRNA